jgi:hypothetical protein
MKAKDLITEKLNEAKAMLPEAEGGPEDEPTEGFRGPEGFDPGDRPPRRAPGPGMRRPMRPGGPGGPPGLLSPRERDAFKAIVMYELLNMAGRDQYYLNLVKTAISGKDPDPGQIQHLLDEAGRISDLLDENQRALLDKLSRMSGQ